MVLFPRSISLWWVGLGTRVAVLNYKVVSISQVVLKIGLPEICNANGLFQCIKNHLCPITENDACRKSLNASLEDIDSLSTIPYKFVTI